MLRLTQKTVGRQETRLREMHGGPLALLEVGGDGAANTAQAEKEDEALSSRLDAVICSPPPPPRLRVRPPRTEPVTVDVPPLTGVVSALDMDIVPDGPPGVDEDWRENTVAVRPGALATWREAQAAAERNGARACLVLSKADLLATILPKGLSVTRAVSLMREQARPTHTPTPAPHGQSPPP